jgi:hypothetical protein
MQQARLRNDGQAHAWRKSCRWTSECFSFIACGQSDDVGRKIAGNRSAGRKHFKGEEADEYLENSNSIGILPRANGSGARASRQG